MSSLEQIAPETTPRRTSGWAVGAFLCSLFVFCLPVSAAGALLGIKALREISRRPDLGGRRLATAGIVIGVLVTLVHAAGAAWWHLNVRRPMISGPITALQAGFDGDLQRYRAGFTAEAANASDREIERFLGDLRGRYGRLVYMRQVSDDRPPPARYQMRAYRIPYEMGFEAGPIKAEGMFVISSPGDGFVGRFAWLAVRDVALGDLVFPESAAVDAVPQSSEVEPDDGT